MKKFCPSDFWVFNSSVENILAVQSHNDLLFVVDESFPGILIIVPPQQGQI